MIREMEFHIYSFEEETRSEVPLTMSDGRLICFKSKERAERFLEEVKQMDRSEVEHDELVDKSYVKNCIVYCDDGYVYEDEAEMEVFGRLLVDRPSISEKIEELIENFYLDSTGDAMLTGTGYYEDVQINEAIDDLFHAEGFEDEDYSSELILTFEGPSCTCYGFALAWVEYDKLYINNFAVYVK